MISQYSNYHFLKDTLRHLNLLHMRKFIIEKVVITLLSSSLFIGFMIFAFNHQDFPSNGKKNAFQQNWQIEKAQDYKGHYTSL